MQREVVFATVKARLVNGDICWFLAATSADGADLNGLPLAQSVPKLCAELAKLNRERDELNRPLIVLV